ncbi:chemotaxis protein CheB [Elioraea rosea]|uniref:chemotaxis protein CheB n=1 Tax=Elioraea rosea TaxID=2492390 RepID=UPI001EF4A9A3|nr:chemotaxis protein CheB [Elioraea rosea]
MPSNRVPDTCETRQAGRNETQRPPHMMGLPVVALGASSGGLDACRKLVAGLPARSGMAFILIQHLDPTHESMMVELLAGHTAMAVCQAEDGMEIAADHLYAIPPGTTLTIRHGRLHLAEPETRRGTRMPFDDLLQSLATECGRQAIAVVLTGTGGDGSRGIASIKEHGGYVIAQDPEEAEFDGMPRSAIETGHVDEILPLAKIPAALLGRAALLEGKPDATPEPHGKTLGECLPAIISLLQTRTGHDFSLYKPGTLQRRIERRMVMAGIPDSAPLLYLTLLDRDPAEREKLAGDLLIHVTGFFRDPQVFAFLASDTLPALVRDAGPEKPLRVWVAGCSSGEEAYSLAILCREAISASGRNIKLQLFASDIDPDAVATAREGHYPATIEADVSPERLGTFFLRESDGYRVTTDLRNDIVFAVQDMLADPPFSRLDMISCRNVLIYLLPDAQAKVLATCHFALRKGGILLLGSSETIPDSNRHFATVAKKERVFRNIVGGRPGEIVLPSAGEAGMKLAGRLAAGIAPSRLNALAELCRRMVIASYAPASVLINHRYECLYSLGPTDRFLQVPPGHPTNDIRAMARRGLALKLRMAINEARDQGRRVVMPGGWRTHDGGAVTVQIDVQPTELDGEKLLLVSFNQEASPPVGKAGDTAPPDVTRVAELERELEATRTALDDAIRDLEVSGDEQKAINDEALSVNEEFQSTNEELLASKEELQSLNEELVALNSQLHETLEQQRATATDLQNVLYSTDVAILFLDPALRIRLFTPATTSLFSILQTDIGRPIADLRSLAPDRDLADTARTVLAGGSLTERELETDAGRWYVRRVMPYRGQDERIAGVVITYSDITERKRVAKALAVAQQQAEAANAAKSRFLAAASHDLRQPLQTLALIRGMLGRAATGEVVATLLARLDQTLDGMSGMLNTLLDINQIEAGTVRAEQVDFPIDTLMSRLHDEFSYAAEAKGLALRRVRCSLVVHSDPRLLEQMIRNLLSNALKYTPRGKVLMGCRRHRGSVTVEIWDTGDGIHADEQEAIFKEYYQVGRTAGAANGGLGLGLSIVKRLGDLLDHGVSVRSQHGKGSVFAIEVPMASRREPLDRPLQPERASDHSSDRKPHVTARILVVEDDPELRELLTLALSGEGHRVVTAADGEQAIAETSTSGKTPDLILADYNLPGDTTGLAVVSALRKRFQAQVPAIILTGNIATGPLVDIAAGDALQLSKPVQLTTLSETIQDLLLTRSSGAHAQQRVPAARQGVDDAKPLVLVVDDDRLIRDGLSAMLEEAGFTVEAYASAEAFLAAWHGQPDACLLADVMLPGLSGLELLRQLRANGEVLPAVIITGHGDVAMAVQAMQVGASDFIEKPVQRDVLVSSIMRAMEQGRDSRHHRARAEEAVRLLSRLTPRQRQIMDLVLAGVPSKNIATDLGISQRTVENHRAAIMHKTEARSLPALARLAVAAAPPGNP